MKYLDIIRDANSNLLRSKVRTFLTISAVFIGAFTLALTNGLGDGIKSYVNTQLGNAGAADILFITPKDADQKTKDENNGLTEYNPDRMRNTAAANGPTGTTLLVENDVSKIAATSGIQQVYRSYTSSPEYMTTGGKKFTASLSQYTEGINFQLDAGRLVSNNSDNEITIPNNLLKPLGLGSYPQAALNKTITFVFKDSGGVLFEKQGKIVGVQAKTLIGGSEINASTRFVKQAQERQLGAYEVANPHYTFLQAKFDAGKGEQSKKDLTDRLAAAGYDAVTFEDQLGVIKSVINAAIVGLNFFGAIALISASFGIINTLYISVQERTKEIGLMKALGLGKRKIFILFSIEAVLIGFWGSLLGVLAANGVGIAINKVAQNTFLKDFEGFNLLAFPLSSKLTVIVIILVISFLAGSLPARKASRKDPIEALRYE